MPGNPRKPRDGITRRRFLTGAAVTAGYLAVSPARRLLGAAPEGTAEERELAHRVILLLVAAYRGPQPKVVHVHNSDATCWDYATGWYGDFMSQNEVDQLVDRGVMELTGTASRAAAWQALIPGYVTGQRIAIKVNLNNSGTVADSDNRVESLIEVVNSEVRGLVDAGASQSDVWVYDAVRSIPDRFRNGCDFPGVVFSGSDVNFQGLSDTQKVNSNEPPGTLLPDQRIS
jgi:hypothetical protein